MPTSSRRPSLVLAAVLLLLVVGPLAAVTAAASSAEPSDAEVEVVHGVVEAVVFRVGAGPGWCSLGLDRNDDGSPDVWVDVDTGDRRAFCDQATSGDRVLVVDGPEEEWATLAYGADITLDEEG